MWYLWSALWGSAIFRNRTLLTDFISKLWLIVSWKKWSASFFTMRCSAGSRIICEISRRLSRPLQWDQFWTDRVQSFPCGCHKNNIVCCSVRSSRFFCEHPFRLHCFYILYNFKFNFFSSSNTLKACNFGPATRGLLFHDTVAPIFLLKFLLNGFH